VHPGSLVEHGDIVLAVVRQGVNHRFDQGTVSVLQTGDRLVIIRPAAAG
jgi:hypothetical protein